MKPQVYTVDKNQLFNDAEEASFFLNREQTENTTSVVEFSAYEALVKRCKLMQETLELIAGPVEFYDSVGEKSKQAAAQSTLDKIKETHQEECPTCEGMGFYVTEVEDESGIESIPGDCIFCDGTGILKEVK